MNLKCENVKLWGNRQTDRRWQRTVEFIAESRLISGFPALDLGPGNEFGKRAFEEFIWKYHHTGDLDLDVYGWQLYVKLNTFDILCCFEVIEHLKNPHQFLSILSNSCKRNVVLFLTYPRGPEWLKSDRHWKEYPDEEFRHLCKESGWEVERYERRRGWHDWWFYLTGVRPFIRFWCKLLWLSRDNLYVLRNGGIEK